MKFLFGSLWYELTMVWTRARASSRSFPSAPACWAFWMAALVALARALTRSEFFLKNVSTSALAGSYSSALTPAFWRNSLYQLTASLAALLALATLSFSDSRRASERE